MTRPRYTLLAAGLTFLALAAGRAAANDNTWTNATTSLTWNLTSNNWTNPTVWSNANVDSAIFGSTGAGTITVGTPITLNAMQFTANGYTLNGSSVLTLTNGHDALLEPGEFQVLSGITATINAPIGGSIGLDKTFPGTLILGGTNTFTGTTIVNGGTLEITGSMTNSTQIDSGATLLFVGGSQSLSGVYSGSGTLAVSETASGSIFVLTSTSNSYTGSTSVQHGTLQLGATNAIPTGSVVTLGSGTNPGVLRLAGHSQTIGGLASSGTGANQVTNFGGSGTNTLTINVPAFQGYTFAGLLGGPATNDNNFGLIVTGGGTQSLTNGSNNYTGGTTVTNAYLSVSDVGALGSGSLQLNGSQLAGSTTESQATWIYTGATATSARPTILSAVGGAIQVSTTGTTLTMGAVISENGTGQALTVFGDGSGGSTLILTNFNTYTGPTVIDNGGVLSIPQVTNGGVAGPLGAASNNPANIQLGGLFGGGTLLYNGTTAGTDRGVTLYSASSNATINVALPDAVLTMSGQLTGAGGLTKAGTGTLILGGANTFTGAATVSTGTLEITGTMNSNVTIAAGATLLFVQSGTPTLSGAYSGAGTLAVSETVSGTAFVLTSTANSYTGTTWVQHGTLQLGASGVIPDSSVVLLGSGSQPGVLRLAGFDEAIGGLQSGGTAVSQVTNFGGSGTNTLTIKVPANNSYTFSGFLGGTVGVDTNFAIVVNGGGTQVLANGSSNYTGGTTVQAGVLQVPGDGSLGAASAPVTVGGAGTLTFTGSTTTARTFNLNFGTLQASAGSTVNLNGAAVIGGFMRGPGTFSITGGAALSGVTTSASTFINQAGAGSFVNFSNGGTLTIAAGLATPASFAVFSNQGSGSIAIGAGSAVNASDFQTYGMLTLAPNTTAVPTILTNAGTSPMYFNGGSQTFIGTPQTADPTGANILDYVDLHGNNAIVAGGLVINNGGIFDTVGAGTGTIIAEFGALVKGAGFYQNTVKTQNGGKFQTGNSPGSATFGNFVFGPGGVNNYVFAIDDATGTAGPTPGPSGLVSGWGLIKAVQVSLGSATTSGSFTWTATPTNPLAVAIDTLVNPTMVGTDVAGPMADFDPSQPYSWTAARWMGTYSGPTDAATLDADTSFDTSGIVNPLAGSFGWSLDAADQTLSLVYTPSSVPEPGTLALVGLAAAAGWWRRRRLTVS